MDHLEKQTRLALRLRSLSIKRWGQNAELILLGRDPGFRAVQQQLMQFARIDRPLLLTGESGVGKEAFARALYLLCERNGLPFMTVNCAQFQSEDLLVSELFGHTKGSFTGAVTDRRGLFEVAEGGVVFLDEVGELTPKAQAMLLRTLGEGEILRLGESEPHHVDVRIVAATNRDLVQMVEDGRFRNDLYYRLCYLALEIPPLRDRGSDWQIILDDYLDDLNYLYKTEKTLGEATRRLLDGYPWPGNVRELRGIADVGYCLTEDVIEPEHVASRLHRVPHARNGRRQAGGTAQRTYYDLESGEADFWALVRKPYLERDLNRSQVRRIVAQGLEETNGSYKDLLPLFGVADSDYLKFMDFLRHHRLKP